MKEKMEIIALQTERQNDSPENTRQRYAIWTISGDTGAPIATES